MNNSYDAPALLERLGRLSRNAGQSDALNPVQWEALDYFARANRFSRSPGALTDYLGLTKGTVSQTIGALERKGLVRKHALPADRRVVSIEVTAAGRDVLAKRPESPVAIAIDRLPDAEQQALGETLATVLKTALDVRNSRPFGECRACRHFERQHPDGEPHRCALLGEPLAEDDAERICREQAPAAIA